MFNRPHVDDRSTQIHLSGDVDRDTMHRLLNEVAEVHLRRRRAVQADLAGVTAIDETDAAAVLFTLLGLRRDGISVEIRGLDHPVLRSIARDVLSPRELTAQGW